MSAFSIYGTQSGRRATCPVAIRVFRGKCERWMRDVRVESSHFQMQLSSDGGEGGDRGLADADATVVRWDRTVHQHAEAFAAQT